MKLKTNLVAAFVLALCFGAIPNLGGCDKNGDVSTPATKPVEEHKVTVQHPDGSTEQKETTVTKSPDGTVQQTHTEDKKTSP